MARPEVKLSINVQTLIASGRAWAQLAKGTLSIAPLGGTTHCSGTREQAQKQSNKHPTNDDVQAKYVLGVDSLTNPEIRLADIAAQAETL